MAFTRSNVIEDSQEDWRSQGFINAYITDAAGHKRKIGTIPLKEKQAMGRSLINKLTADPDWIKELQSRIELVYSAADADGEIDLDLPKEEVKTSSKK